MGHVPRLCLSPGTAVVRTVNGSGQAAAHEREGSLSVDRLCTSVNTELRLRGLRLLPSCERFISRIERTCERLKLLQWYKGVGEGWDDI